MQNKTIILIQDILKSGASLLIAISVFILFLKGLKYILNTWSIIDCILCICFGLLIWLITNRTQEETE